MWVENLKSSLSDVVGGVELLAENGTNYVGIEA